MNPEAMAPYGLALTAYYEGDTAARLIVRRDDGREVPLPVSFFFRDPCLSTAIDKIALDHCRGRVLDVGAGTGLHSLALRRRGLHVTSIDICVHAVKIMRHRDLPDVHVADIFGLKHGCYDTLLMMGHGIGLVETIDGLKRFLAHSHSLLSNEGQVLVDSLDVRVTDDRYDQAYQDDNKRAGRYIGEIRMQFEFRGEKGPYCGWLHVDAETLKQYAESAGWSCEVVHREEEGNYLARLAKKSRPI